MKKIILTILILTSTSVIADERAVRLDDNQNIISSEVIVTEFDSNRELEVNFDINEQDLVTDSDMDGLSDFVEENVYYTDASKVSTLGDFKDDRVKILLGQDPLSEAPLGVKYEDVKEDTESKILDILAINEVSVLDGKLSLKGTGLPNSLTSIFIHDLNLVATVVTDELGDWEYVISNDISDGKHDVYIGILNAEGSVVAKGEKVVIKKDNSLVEINPGFSFDFRIGMDADDFYEFVFKYFWFLVFGVIILGSLVAGVLVAVYETGKGKE